jgi:hypothetical protein
MFCSKSITAPITSASTVDTGKIRLGGGYRLPVKGA